MNASLECRFFSRFMTVAYLCVVLQQFLAFNHGQYQEVAHQTEENEQNVKRDCDHQRVDWPEY